jgi:hypothetical protein
VVIYRGLRRGALPGDHHDLPAFDVVDQKSLAKQRLQVTTSRI